MSPESPTNDQSGVDTSKVKTGTEGDITTVEEVVVTGVRTSQHEGSFVGAVGGFISPLGHAATGGASAIGKAFLAIVHLIF